MDRDAVVERLCELATKVRDQHFGLLHPTDCFCEGASKFNFQFSPEVIEFIEQAVNEKLIWEQKVLPAEQEEGENRGQIPAE
jgi:hypothetical protein